MDSEKPLNRKELSGTVINLSELFEMQQKLDNHIMTKHPELKGQNNLDWKILALQVEIGECANEWRGFKKWSDRQTPKMFPQETCDYCSENVDYTRPTPFMADTGANMCKVCWDYTKEEYAASNGEYITAFEDYPHFPEKKPIKLIEEYVDGLHFVLSIGLELGVENLNIRPFKYKDITTQFNAIFRRASNPRLWISDYIKLCDEYLGLGGMLGFTWEEIEKAYFEKNAVNHQRQEEGY